MRDHASIARRAARTVATLIVAAAATASSAHGETRDATLAARDSALAAAIAATVRADAPAGIAERDWRRARALYDAESHRALWMSGARPSARAAALVDALGRAHEHGLRRTDYPLERIADALAGMHAAAPGAADVARVDVLLTSAFAAYADDMLTGRLDPRRIEASWHIDARAVDVDSAMRRALRAPDLAAALARLAPDEDGYDTLVRALARYRTIAERGGWPTVGSGPTLRVGDSARVIPTLRARLEVEGYGPVASPHDSAAWRYLPGDSAAVARFQARHGLVVDGIVGPRTRAALDVRAADRAGQIVANLERYRWLPPDLGERRIVVNIPAFRLDAWDGDRRALSMRVVVGSELASRRTPVFSDSMSYVQFGPYWNVPRSIAVNEILPQARRDRGHLARRDFEIVRGWAPDAPVVDPWTLSDAELTSARYRVRQRPGPQNALGRVKFMFPNDFAVYLHDTPADALFDERRRAFSHGCVRVADPAALAAFVLAPDPAWDEARIRRTLAAGERVRVNLDRGIPVYLIYLTAFAQGDAVAFREDLYDRDDTVRRALGDVRPSAAAAAVVSRIERLVE